MSERAAEPSFTPIARTAGVLLLLMAVAAGFAELGVHRALVVPGDAAATAGRIAASGWIFRLGFVGYLVAFLCDVPVAVLLYLLVRRVSAPLALTAAALRLVYAAVATSSLVGYLGPTLVASGAHPSAFDPAQLQTFTLLSLEAFEQGFGVALVPFGVHLVLLGILLLKSSDFPKILGVLVAVAGLAYLVDSFSRVVAPGFHAAAAPFLAACAMLELVLAVWLLTRAR
jgi:hypothetical protein